MQGWTVVAVAIVYFAALFAVAAYGDARRPAWLAGRARPYVYALGLGVYCTAWAFFGAVGFAAASGWAFLALALGPMLAIGLFRPLVARVVRLAKAQSSTSVADLIGARYGKSQIVAGLVATLGVAAALPYLALQLKAIAIAFGAALGGEQAFGLDPALVAAVGLAAFAALFGTRQVEATERHDGLMLAIATESAVKLAAMLAVGAFVTFSMFDGPGDLYAKASAAGVAAPFEQAPPAAAFVAMALISFAGALLLPRQFHVTVVESRGPEETATAAWAFPLYVTAMSLFVAPLALAGLTTFGAGADPDLYVLTLPVAVGAPWIATVAVIGGLSAATAMVIVEAVALAIMVSNDLAIPAMLRGRAATPPDMSRRLLAIRRAAIVVILLAAYAVHRIAGTAQLASLGLLALAAAAQLAPAFFGGLMWRRATARGAAAGIGAGLVVWAWTLALPAFAGNLPGAAGLVAHGPFGLDWLRPQALFWTEAEDSLAHGVFWSLGLNILAFVGASLSRAPSAIERQQADAFEADGAPPAPEGPAAAPFRPWRSRVTAGDVVQTVARYLGPDRAERAFRGYEIGRGGKLESAAEADVQTLRFAEHLLASAIGAASSRLVLSLLLSRRNVTTRDALQLLDDASAALQSNRDILQTALDNARQGITAIDRDMKLVAWNREFRQLFDLPEEMIYLGVGLDDIFRFNAARGLYGPVNAEEFVADRIERFVIRLETMRTRLQPSGRVIEIRSARMPDGGVVTTYTDITETVASQQALEVANENLERRVRERTRELTRLNQELARAKTVADETNISKTRFLAAASHDILQPLNAARLFAASLVERTGPEDDHGRLARNVDASLDAVEEILSALLDISRLDTGAMRPELSTFRLDDIVAQLAREFAPLASEKGLRLAVIPTALSVRSDRKLLRRVLQNLVSNAIKYTPRGRVIVGVRRLKGRVRVEVWDTGLGIASGQQQLVFREFKRLEQGARIAPGLGLGLSIVERIARVLDHPLTLRSTPGQGSVFAIELPTAAATPALRPVEAPAPSRAAALTGLVVLAIDNEPAILDGMATLLTGWGCTALVAASQREAEQLLRREKRVPDVLLADYHLDEADGLEAVVSLRWKLGKPIPAVLITADRSPFLRAQAAEKDVQMLPKPIRPAALRALLAQMLAQRAAAE